MSVKAVAAYFKTRTAVITELLRSTDVELHPGGRTHPKFHDDECRAVAARYAEGASLAALAREFDCSTPTISNAIERGGGQLRQPGAPKIWTDQRLRWAEEQYRDGRSQQSIADELGVHQTVVSARLRMMGVIPIRPRPTGADSPGWKGGRHITPKGYAWVAPRTEDLPFCRPNSTGYVPEHRLVMGRAFGRRLDRNETVHHINGDRADNRIGNLQLRQGNHGKGTVVVCNMCGSYDLKAIEITD